MAWRIGWPPWRAARTQPPGAAGPAATAPRSTPEWSALPPMPVMLGPARPMLSPAGFEAALTTRQPMVQRSALGHAAGDPRILTEQLIGHGGAAADDNAAADNRAAGPVVELRRLPPQPLWMPVTSATPLTALRATEAPADPSTADSSRQLDDESPPATGRGQLAPEGSAHTSAPASKDRPVLGARPPIGEPRTTLPPSVQKQSHAPQHAAPPAAPAGGSAHPAGGRAHRQPGSLSDEPASAASSPTADATAGGPGHPDPASDAHLTSESPASQSHLAAEMDRASATMPGPPDTSGRSAPARPPVVQPLIERAPAPPPLSVRPLIGDRASITAAQATSQRARARLADPAPAGTPPPTASPPAPVPLVAAPTAPRLGQSAAAAGPRGPWSAPAAAAAGPWVGPTAEPSIQRATYPWPTSTARDTESTSTGRTFPGNAIRARPTGPAATSVPPGATAVVGARMPAGHGHMAVARLPETEPPTGRHPWPVDAAPAVARLGDDTPMPDAAPTEPPPTEPAPTEAAPPPTIELAAGLVEGSAARPGERSPDEMADLLYDRIRDRLADELRRDRERAGLATGLR